MKFPNISSARGLASHDLSTNLNGSPIQSTARSSNHLNLEPPPITEFLFKDPSTQKEPREDTLQLCKQMNINPETIKLREDKELASFEEYKNRGASPNRLNIIVSHYN